MSATILDLRTGVDKDAVAIGNLCSKARGSMVDSVKYLIEAGQKLIAKKKSLEHGEWLPWLKENKDALGFGHPTATRLMKAADKYCVDATFGETEAAQISKSIWGNTKSTKRPRARKPHYKENDIIALFDSGFKYNEISKQTEVGERAIRDIIERELARRDAIAKTIDSLHVDPKTLATSAKAKLEIARRQIERELKAEHTTRMHKLDEEVRQRVLKEGKEYLADLKKERDKVWETEKFYREMTNNRQHIFTIDQFNLIRKCLHQNGIAATPKDFDAAFDLIQRKKLQLTGQK